MFHRYGFLSIERKFCPSTQNKIVYLIFVSKDNRNDCHSIHFGLFRSFAKVNLYNQELSVVCGNCYCHRWHCSQCHLWLVLKIANSILGERLKHALIQPSDIM